MPVPVSSAGGDQMAIDVEAGGVTAGNVEVAGGPAKNGVDRQRLQRVDMVSRAVEDAAALSKAASEIVGTEENSGDSGPLSLSVAMVKRLYEQDEQSSGSFRQSLRNQAFKDCLDATVRAVIRVREDAFERTHGRTEQTRPFSEEIVRREEQRRDTALPLLVAVRDAMRVRRTALIRQRRRIERRTYSAAEAVRKVLGTASDDGVTGEAAAAAGSNATARSRSIEKDNVLLANRRRRAALRLTRARARLDRARAAAARAEAAALHELQSEGGARCMALKLGPPGHRARLGESQVGDALSMGLIEGFFSKSELVSGPPWGGTRWQERVGTDASDDETEKIGNEEGGSQGGGDGVEDGGDSSDDDDMYLPHELFHGVCDTSHPAFRFVFPGKSESEAAAELTDLGVKVNFSSKGKGGKGAAAAAADDGDGDDDEEDDDDSASDYDDERGGSGSAGNRAAERRKNREEKRVLELRRKESLRRRRSFHRGKLLHASLAGPADVLHALLGEKSGGKRRRRNSRARLRMKRNDDDGGGGGGGGNFRDDDRMEVGSEGEGDRIGAALIPLALALERAHVSASVSVAAILASTRTPSLEAPTAAPATAAATAAAVGTTAVDSGRGKVPLLGKMVSLSFSPRASPVLGKVISLVINNDNSNNNNNNAGNIDNSSEGTLYRVRFADGDEMVMTEGEVRTVGDGKGED